METHGAARTIPDKYLMISADCHCNEPSNLWVERIDRKFRDRLPRIEVDENGVKWAISEGWARSRLLDSRLEGEDHLRSKAGADPEQRLKDQIRDGVDAEIIFPNKGLTMWATPDADFAHAQCRIYNDWAWETFAKYNDRMSPLAAIATADLPGSIAEVERVAKLGFRGLTLPCKPIFGAHDARHPNYNLPIFDPLWSVIQEADLPITFHVSTGRDPRAARKDGGAVINYVSHSLVPTIEPVANLCGSGVLERFPGNQICRNRIGHRMGRVGSGSHGRGLSQASHVGVAAAQDAAERVFPRARIRVVPGRSGRPRSRGEI